MKSRLEARGDFSFVFSRSVSPAADKEAVFFGLEICSIASASHSYWRPGTRILPRISIVHWHSWPSMGVVTLAADCGEEIAGWFTMEHGLRENLSWARCTQTHSGVIEIQVSMHVDNHIWTSEPRADHIMHEGQKILIFGTQEEKSFDFVVSSSSKTAATRSW